MLSLLHKTQAKLVLHLKKKKKLLKMKKSKNSGIERMARTLPGKCRAKGRGKKAAINNNR